MQKLWRPCQYLQWICNNLTQALLITVRDVSGDCDTFDDNPMSLHLQSTKQWLLSHFIPFQTSLFSTHGHFYIQRSTCEHEYRSGSSPFHLHS